MIDTSSKHSLKRDTDQDFLQVSVKREKGRDEENPLSFVDASITIVGIILAILTISLPAISVLLERPFHQSEGITINQTFKKDGY